MCRGDIFNIVVEYSDTWCLFLEYDENRLPKLFDGKHITSALEIEKSNMAIRVMKRERMAKGEASAIFGNFEQTLSGKTLYQGCQEKSSNLLHIVIKDHPFTDGNKRIC